MLTAGAVHTCHVRPDATLWCWGENTSAQLGDGTLEPAPEPRRIAPEQRWRAVASAHFHTCSITRDDDLWCWGENDYGQVLAGEKTWVPHPTRPAVDPELRWREVSPGGSHTCAIDVASRLWCWGRNSYGEVEPRQLMDQFPPREVEPNLRWAMVSAGVAHTCAIDTTSRLWCWGDIRGIELRHELVEVARGQRFEYVDTNTDHTCAVASDPNPGQLWCWGDNLRGRTTFMDASAREPSPTRHAHDWIDVELGLFHTCGRRGKGYLWCWGSNHLGQLGNDPKQGTYNPDPGQLSEGPNVVAVALGYLHGCGLSTAGRVTCWGQFTGRTGYGLVAVGQELGWGYGLTLK